MPNGKLFIFSSPSGCGKTTVIRELMDRNEPFHYSVSATTRTPRSGESNGVHYHFFPIDVFKQGIHKGLFYEWACVFGQYYGTLKDEIDPYLNQGKTILLDLDVQGGIHLKNEKPDAVLVFLLPPSMQELHKRLLGRKTENHEELAERLRTAEKELAVADRYDYQIINDRFLDTVAELEKWIQFYKN